MRNGPGKVRRVLQAVGFLALAKRALLKRLSDPAIQALPVNSRDAIDAFKVPPRKKSKFLSAEHPATLGWVMPPPSVGSGGHQNMFRFIKFAETAGFQCKVYFYVNGTFGFEEASMKNMLEASGAYPSVNASMEMFERDKPSLQCLDALFASSWETAYAVQVAKTDAKRLYFVQDYEPDFYPAGSLSILAEQTYQFGFTGISAGNWLAQKLSSEFGMETHAFDFAIDPDRYFLTNPMRRDEIFFYARPGTERRGFELGLLALSEVLKERPETIVHFAGEQVSKRDVPFKFVSHGMLAVDELRALYNRCAAALVISATNMSLLPLELLACGVVPVVNTGRNNTLVSSNKHIQFVAPSPPTLAEALLNLVSGTQGENPSPDTLNKSVIGFTWDDSGAQFLRGLTKALYG